MTDISFGFTVPNRCVPCIINHRYIKVPLAVECRFSVGGEKKVGNKRNLCSFTKAAICVDFTLFMRSIRS